MTGVESMSSNNEADTNTSVPKPKALKLKWFDEALRLQIMKLHNLSQFPKVRELNQYINLYEKEFHPYFDFIHLPSIKPKIENHSILTSIACIGALYSFHSFHCMQLFSISRHHVSLSCCCLLNRLQSAN